MTGDLTRRNGLAGFVLLACSTAWLHPANGDESALFQEIPSVYGASKYEQRVDEAPSAVSIITAEEIRKYGYRNLGDVLRSVRGFYVFYDRSYTFAGVRGFGRLGDYNSRILLLVDGYRTNEDIYNMAFIGNESIVDIDMIDRVEVIRGPGSSLYGSNAFFAVINVITKRGRDIKGAEVSGEVASADTSKVRATYGDRGESGHELLLSASYYDSAGNRLYFPEYAAEPSNGYVYHGDSERYRNFLVKDSVGDLTFSVLSVDREKGGPIPAFGSIFNDPRSQIQDPRQTTVNVKFDHPISRDTQLMLQAGYNAYDYAGYSPMPASVGPPYPAHIDEGASHGRWWTLEAMLRTNVSDRHKVICGVDDQYDSRQYQIFQDSLGVVSYLDERTSNRWGIYVQDEFRAADRLLFNLGVRHDQYRDFGGTTNPRLAMVYRTSRNDAFKLLYGRAFRAPTPYEVFYNDYGFPLMGVGPLQPETITTYEAVVEHPLRRDLRASAALYHYTADKLINFMWDAVDGGIWVFGNIGRVDANGVELELEGRLFPRLDGRLSYAYQQNEVNDAAGALSNSPQHLVKANLSTPIVEEKLVAGFEAQYTSRRLNDSGFGVKGYTISNLVFTSRYWLRNAELTFGIYNLFDVRYADLVSDLYAPVSAVQQDGRTFRGKATVRF